MVNFCAVLRCGNRGDRDKDKSFYRLPSIVTHQGSQTKELCEKRRTSWLAAINRQDIKPANFPYTRVCSDHFISGKPAGLYDTTNPDWIPTLKLGHQLMKPGDLCRHTRAVARDAKKRKIEEDTIQSATTMASDVESDCTSNSEDLADEIEKLNIDLKKTKEELLSVSMNLEKTHKELMAYRLDEEGFRDNDEKVCYYLGLPKWDVLLAVFTFLQPYLSNDSRRSLSPFQQLLLVLMRLRLDLSVQDLAYRFGIHKSTVSRTFTEVIEIMYIRLKPLILWPDRDTLRKTMPMDFRKHCPNCAVIIDCFELFVERPSNLLARAQTYSSYKHHNTVKYLIGITPQGTVCFLSEGWGGRVSDKHITENSGLLRYLLPGDTVLADRGFDIKELLAMHCARILIPAFTRGKQQLTGIEVEQTRRIANVRIHVERVIGVLRQKFSILSGTQPIDNLLPRNDGMPLLDKIVCVCCALVNVCDSVVPFN